MSVFILFLSHLKDHHIYWGKGDQIVKMSAFKPINSFKADRSTRRQGLWFITKILDRFNK